MNHRKEKLFQQYSSCLSLQINKKVLISTVAIFLLFAFSVNAFAAQLKVSDLARVKELRGRQVFGYGIVVGLKGSGDSRRFSLTNKLIKNMMQSLGQRDMDSILVSRNTAAVIVTAKVPPFASIGDRLDISVASVGDARSLDNGLLVQTPLYGLDKKIYVMAQGPVTMQPRKDRNQRSGGLDSNHGLVMHGGIVEKRIPINYIHKNRDRNLITLVFQGKDFLHIPKVRELVNKKFPDVGVLRAQGNELLLSFKNGNLHDKLNAILDSSVEVPDTSRIVLDENNGVLVISNRVSISPFAFSIDGLVQKEDKNANDLASLYGIDDKGKKGKSVFYLESSSDLKEIVQQLNKMGVSTKELISLLKAMEKSGALHGELIIK